MQLSHEGEGGTDSIFKHLSWIPLHVERSHIVRLSMLKSTSAKGNQHSKAASDCLNNVPDGTHVTSADSFS
jgi:hypothetical protein